MSSANGATGQPNKESRVFDKVKGDLAKVIQHSIEPVAQRCRGKKLIAGESYDKLFTGQWSHDQHRARYFMNCFCERLNVMQGCGPLDQVKSEIGKLASIVRDEQVLQHIADEIDSCSTCEELEEKVDVSSGICGSLSSIVNKAHGEGLITSDECTICLLPDGQHNELITQLVLNEVGSNIELYPNKMTDFLVVLNRMGSPISDFAVRIREELFTATECETETLMEMEPTCS
jgi:hypothetical protein